MRILTIYPACINNCCQAPGETLGITDFRGTLLWLWNFFPSPSLFFQYIQNVQNYLVFSWKSLIILQRWTDFGSSWLQASESRRFTLRCSGNNFPVVNCKRKMKLGLMGTNVTTEASVIFFAPPSPSILSSLALCFPPSSSLFTRHGPWQTHRSFLFGYTTST